MANSFLQSYDDAVKHLLYSKFAAIMGIDTSSSDEGVNINLGVYNFPKEVAQRVSAEKRGQTYLEFINFWRVRAGFSWERNRSVLSRRGMWVGDADVVGSRTVHVKAVPMDLTYDVWFWSVSRDKLYKVMEEYAFWQQDNPKVTLTYIDDSGNEYPMTPDIHLGDIVDESTVLEQFREGIKYIIRMPITVDAWALKGINWNIISKILVTFYDKDDLDTAAEYSTVIVEDEHQDTELEAALKYFSRAIYDDYSIDLVANSISVRGDFASDFAAGDRIDIWNSTDNDGPYIVSSNGADYDSTTGVTTIELNESLISATADGTIYKKGE